MFMEDYKKLYTEKKSKQLTLWKKMITQIFNGEYTNFLRVNESLKIIDKNEIIQILKFVGENDALNHTFMPSGGGLDLSGAKDSFEDGLIELNFDESTLIVQPDSLLIHLIGDNPEWWYLRLDSLPFKESGVYKEQKITESEKNIKTLYHGEQVVELSPGEYIDRLHWEVNNLGYDEDGHEVPLPENARLVTRKYNGGSYVIFPKFSSYNHNPATYDARHNKVNDENFKLYINNIVNYLNK